MSLSIRNALEKHKLEIAQSNLTYEAILPIIEKTFIDGLSWGFASTADKIVYEAVSEFLLENEKVKNAHSENSVGSEAGS